MIAHPQPQLMPPQEYLGWEEEQPIKYEYINGEVFVMKGGFCPITLMPSTLPLDTKITREVKAVKSLWQLPKSGFRKTGHFTIPM